jgi:TamB, inner membrane protein subunit of TAM complex
MAESRRPLLNRALRWGSRLVAGGLGLVGLALVTFVLFLRTEAGNDWLLSLILPQIQPPKGAIEVARLRTDLFTELRLEAVAIRGAEGQVLLAAEEAKATYSLGTLPALLPVSKLELRGLRGDLSLGEEGLDLAALWGPGDPDAPPSSLPLRIRIAEVAVDLPHLSLKRDSERYAVEEATLRGGVELWGRSVAISNLSLKVPRATPAVGDLSLSFSGSYRDGRVLDVDQAQATVGKQQVAIAGVIGDVATTGNLDLQLLSAHLYPNALPPELVDLSALQLGGPFQVAGTIRGNYLFPRTDLALQIPEGSANLSGGFNTQTGEWSATLLSPDLPLHKITGLAPPLHIDGEAKAEGVGTDPATWTIDASFDGRVHGLPSVGSLAVGLTGKLVGQDLDVPRLRLVASGLSGRGSGRWDLAGQTGSFAIQDLLLDLRHVPRVPQILAIIPNLPPEVAEGAQSLRDLDLGGVLSWSGVISRDANRGILATGELGGEQLRLGEDLALAQAKGPLSVHFAEGLAQKGPVGPPVLASLLAGTTLSLSGLRAGPLEAESGVVTAGLDRSRIAWSFLLKKQGEEELLASDGHLDRADGAWVLDHLRGAVPTATGTLPGLLSGSGKLAGDSGENWELRALDLQGQLGTATLLLSGQGGARLPLDMQVQVDALEPSMLSGVAPTADWEGKTTLAGVITGALKTPQVAGALLVQKLRIPGSIRNLDAELGIELSTDALHVEGEGAGVKLSASLPLRLDPPGPNPDGPLYLKAELPPTESTTLQALLEGVELPMFRSSVSLELGGTPARPTGKLVTTTFATPGEKKDRIQVDLDALLTGQEVTITGTLWERSLPRAAVGGTIPVDVPGLMAQLLAGKTPTQAEALAAVGNLNLNLNARKVPLRYLADVSGEDIQTEGLIIGNLHVGGSLEAPQMRGAFLLDHASLGTVAIEQGSLTVSPAAGGYDLALKLGFGKDTGLDFSGFVPLVLDISHLPTVEQILGAPGLSLNVGGDGVPLALAAAFVPGFGGGVGNLKLSGTVVGSVLDPDPNLALHIEKGGFSLDQSGVLYQNLEIDATLDRTSLDLTRLGVETLPLMGEDLPGEKQVSRVDGHIRVESATGWKITENWAPTRVVGELEMKGFRAAALADRTLRVSGITRVGTDGQKVTLKGDLRVDRASIRLRQDFFAEDNDLELHPDIQIVGVDRNPFSGPQGIPGLLDLVPAWFRASLDVDLADSLYGSIAMPLEDRFGKLGQDFSTVRVEGALSGKAKVELGHGLLLITGSLEPSRGQARVLGKTFTVKEGTIAFTGRDFLSPLVDVRALYPTAAYGDMEVQISGTPEKPTVKFSSERWPEEDVLAILLTGRPASETGNSGAIPTQLLTSALMAVAQDTLGESSGGGVVESVQLDTLGVQGGFRISRTLSLYTRYNFRNGSTGEPATVEVTLEWSLPRDWSLEIRGGGNGQSISAWHTWRF